MDLRQFTKDEVRDLVKKDRPTLILLTGQTCMGKSTFARSLVEFGYKHVEVDLLIKREIVNKFKISNENEAYLVYRGGAPAEWQDMFEKIIKKVIVKELKTSKVIVDAAIADVGVLKRIFSGELEKHFCIYLYPFDKELYFQSILNRFLKDVENKTKTFTLWDYVTPEIYSDFLKHGKNSKKISKVVTRYRDESIELSVERLNNYKQVCPNIILSGN